MADRFERLEEDVDARVPPPLQETDYGPMGRLADWLEAARALVASNVLTVGREILYEAFDNYLYSSLSAAVRRQTRTVTSLELRNFLTAIRHVGYRVPAHHLETYERFHRELVVQDEFVAAQSRLSRAEQERAAAVLGFDLPVEPLDRQVRDQVYVGGTLVGERTVYPVVQDPAAPDGLYVEPRPFDPSFDPPLPGTIGYIYRQGIAPVTSGVVYPGDPTIYPVPRDLQRHRSGATFGDEAHRILEEQNRATLGAYEEGRELLRLWDSLGGTAQEVPRPPRDRETIEAETRARYDALDRGEDPTFYEERDALPGGFYDLEGPLSPSAQAMLDDLQRERTPLEAHFQNAIAAQHAAFASRRLIVPSFETDEALRQQYLDRAARESQADIWDNLRARVAQEEAEAEGLNTEDDDDGLLRW
jgi:hypothetical protein